MVRRLRVRLRPINFGSSKETRLWLFVWKEETP
jgi:hypothetical protein